MNTTHSLLAICWNAPSVSTRSMRFPTLHWPRSWSASGYDAKAESEAKIGSRSFRRPPTGDQSLSIEGRSHEYARDLPGAIEIYKTLRNFFPDDLDYALRLASVQTKADLGKECAANHFARTSTT